MGNLPGYWESVLSSSLSTSYWNKISGAERIVARQLPASDIGAVQYLIVMTKGDVTVSFTIIASEILTHTDFQHVIEKKLVENSPWAPCQECDKKDKEIKENESLRREGLAILVRICSALEKEFGSQRDVPGIRS